MHHIVNTADVIGHLVVKVNHGQSGKRAKWQVGEVENGRSDRHPAYTVVETLQDNPQNLQSEVKLHKISKEL